MISTIAGMAVAVIGYYPCIFLHEMGHLGAALLSGWTPLVFRCGTGRRVTALKIGDLHFQFGLRPDGGLVHAVANSAAGFRMKWLFFTLGGPAVTVGTICGLWELLQFVLRSATTPEWIPIAIGTLALMQAILLIITVIPHMTKVDELEFPNDGMQVFQSITGSAKAMAEHYFNHQVFKGQIYLERGDQKRAQEVLERVCRDRGMDTMTRCTTWIQLLLEQGRSDEANLAMTSAADNWQPLGKTRGEVLDGLACLPLFYGSRELTEQAMNYIDEAILEEPESITFKGTKGSLLVESGKSEEGLKLLTEVLKHTKSENDMAICSYYIALAHSKLGDFEKGFKLLKEASLKYPECVVRPRVTKSFWDMHESAKAIA
jgi:hypothetical protein